MTTYSAGITAVLARMDTNPSEFFGAATKWEFIFKERFREVLTEPEKGALHEKLKEVRRQEFDHQVMRTLLDSEMQGTISSNMWGNSISGQTTTTSTVNAAALKQQIQNQAASLLQSEFDRSYGNNNNQGNRGMLGT